MVTRREALAALAGIGPVLGQREDVTFSADVNVVNVLATVRDQHGRLVHGLRKDDFSIEEDGRPQVIRYFAPESDLPLTLGLLVDTSASQIPVLNAEQRASYKFLSQVLRAGQDRAFIIRFDTKVDPLQTTTESRTQLEAALLSVGASERAAAYDARRDGTKLYDAISFASDEVLKNQSGRKALIVLSDGGDTSSRSTIATAIESAQRQDTLVYTVLISGLLAAHLPLGRRPVIFGPGRKTLAQISTETGGGAFEVSSKDAIEGIYARIDEELRNQYSLGYTSDQTGAGPRKIQLTVRRKNYSIQTRGRYYAVK